MLFWFWEKIYCLPLSKRSCKKVFTWWDLSSDKNQNSNKLFNLFSPINFSYSLSFTLFSFFLIIFRFFFNLTKTFFFQHKTSQSFQKCTLCFSQKISYSSRNKTPVFFRDSENFSFVCYKRFFQISSEQFLIYF